MSDRRTENRCAAKCSEEGCGAASRRDFLRGSAALVAGAALGSVLGLSELQAAVPLRRMRACGPASAYVPKVRAAFVRREGEYGMRWPGAVYDGEAARKKYTAQITASAKKLGIELDLRGEPLFTQEQSDAWLAEAKDAQPDGLLLVMLDRQEHAWPTATKASQSGIPSVVFSPLGTSFTTNTTALADTPGCVVFSTNDTRQLDFGLKMLGAGARMRRARCICIKGAQRTTHRMADLGIELQRVPASMFLDEYNALAVSAQIEAMADSYMRKARAVRGATRQDVVNGIKSYFVAGKILEREEGDAITMDCLGALGHTKVSLPCIAWSRMNDDGIPAACEADHGAVAAHIVTQYLFDRPGFQQDPVADTSDDTIIGAHCSSPTRLKGFDEKPEPFELIHHHGNRDAVPRTLWRVGQRVTCLDIVPRAARSDTPTQLLVSVGTVVENLDVPPSGGCVVSVKVKFDGGHKVLSFPGFHQLFIYGDHQRELLAFSQLYKLNAQVV